MNTTTRRAWCFLSSSRVTPHWLKSPACHFSSSACCTCVVVLDSLRPLSTSTCPFPSSSTPCTQTSTTLIRWEITCATPPRGVLTPTTSPSPSQVMRPTTMSLTNSSTPRVPSPALPCHRTRDMDDTTLGKLLAEVRREYADYRSLESVFLSPSSMLVMSDKTGKPVEENNVDQSNGCHEKNVQYSQLISCNHSSWKNCRSNGKTYGKDVRYCWGTWKLKCAK